MNSFLVFCQPVPGTASIFCHARIENVNWGWWWLGGKEMANSDSVGCGWWSGRWGSHLSGVEAFPCPPLQEQNITNSLAGFQTLLRWTDHNKTLFPLNRSILTTRTTAAAASVGKESSRYSLPQYMTGTLLCLSQKDERLKLSSECSENTWQGTFSISQLIMAFHPFNSGSARLSG